MKRLVCIVEGKGEVRAIPTLCYRIFDHLGVQGWVVDKEPIKQPRSLLVDARMPGPKRRCREEEVIRVLELARRTRKPDAVLMLCDEDDDCAAAWGPDATRVMGRITPGTVAVMAVREYETWLLLARDDASLRAARIHQPDKVRDAKKSLAVLVPGYLPTTHQLSETRGVDVAFLRTRSKSFDKLVRSIAALCGAPESPAAA
ncbi:hypothetical protein ACLESO_37510 [Pyxidicoccus sp. 3LG]